MRKSRKKAADDSASSTPPPSPGPVKAELQPVCMFCRCTPAKGLQVTHLPGTEPAIFCSVHCAATWAITRIVSERIEWCEKHQRWTERKGHCYPCKLEREGYSDALLPSDVAAQGGEQEVQP